jgi:hypothetical protein
MVRNDQRPSLLRGKLIFAGKRQNRLVFRPDASFYASLHEH